MVFWTYPGVLVPCQWWRQTHRNTEGVRIACKVSFASSLGTSEKQESEQSNRTEPEGFRFSLLAVTRHGIESNRIRRVRAFLPSVGIDARAVTLSRFGHWGTLVRSTSPLTPVSIPQGNVTSAAAFFEHPRVRRVRLCRMRDTSDY